MKKLLMRLCYDSDGGAIRRGFVVVSAGFVIGALVGGLCAAYGGEIDRLAARELIPEIDRIDLLTAATAMFRYPLLALLCGLAVFGVVAEPLIAATRGFFLCFAATALFRLYGSGGLLLVAASGAVECLVSIPCMLLMCTEGFVSSSAMIACIGGRAKPGSISSYFLRVAIVLALLALGTVAEMYLTPLLTSLAAGLIR